MSDLSGDQLAQRIYECGLMGVKQLDVCLSQAGGRGRASLNDFIMVLLEGEHMTNWQISRVVEGHRRGYFYGNWKILYMIGAGTFARVYRAEHRKTGDIKAVKVLRQRYAKDEDTRESFLREARMVMKLRHPNIVPIHEVDEDKGRIYMVMDFVEGQNLRDYVRAHKRIPNLTALHIIRDVAAGLAYAASQGVYHRDMKLSNVLISSTRQAKLVDFGLATMSGVKDDDGKEGPRSIDYAGLEKCTGVKRNDLRSDIYFVGCMLYHMVSGEPALTETRERMKRLSSRRYTEAAPVTVHEPGLPHRIVILINRLMELDAEKRIQTAEQTFQETESVLKALESGDAAQYDAELSEKEAQQYEDMLTQQEEGRGKTLLLIESNIKVQDSLRERLKEIGYRVLITGDPVRGLARFEDLDPSEDSPADCVMFGCAGLGREGVAAFENFATGEHTSRCPSILVATEAIEQYAKPALFNDHRVKMLMPIKFKQLKYELRRLLDIKVARKSANSKNVSGTVSGNSDDTDVDLG